MKRMNTLCSILFGVLALLLVAPPIASAQVDLHAHLEMKPGVGALLDGSGSEDPQAMHFETRRKSKAALSRMDPAELLPITVVSLYGHPILPQFFTLSWKDNVRNALEEEYRLVLRFVDKNSTRVGIAKNASEARGLLKTGKKVIILSIEGAYGALESEEDFRTWIDDRGVAIITPFHLTGDHFGDTAILDGINGFFSSPLRFLQSVILSWGTCLKTFCVNPGGIKEDGEALIRTLREKKVWIDLAHASDTAINSLLPEFAKEKLPILITHTALRSFHTAERGMNDFELEYLKKYGGMVGLLPSDDFLDGMKRKSECFSGITAFRSEIKLLASKIGEEKVVFGSDVNAPLYGLSPFCKNHELNVEPLELSGFYRYSEIGALWKYVAPSSTWGKRTTEQFLKYWEQIRP